MKRIKKHHAQWALGASATLASLGSAQAALVKVDLNHDLTTSLDGVDFGFGLGSDAGQWINGADIPYSSAGSRIFSFSRIGGGISNNIARHFGPFDAAIFSAGTAASGVFGQATTYGPGFFNDTVTGLIAWNLADGTEGWLVVDTLWSGPTARSFVFDDAEIGVAGGRTAGNLTHGGNSGAFAGASNFTGAAVPEPSSLALLALGAAGVIGRRRRQAA